MGDWNIDEAMNRLFGSGEPSQPEQSGWNIDEAMERLFGGGAAPAEPVVTLPPEYSGGGTTNGPRVVLPDFDFAGGYRGVASGRAGGAAGVRLPTVRYEENPELAAVRRWKALQAETEEPRVVLPRIFTGGVPRSAYGGEESYATERNVIAGRPMVTAPGGYLRSAYDDEWSYLTERNVVAPTVINNPAQNTNPSRRTRENYYVMVQGCYPVSTQPPPCVDNAPEWDFQNYLVALRKHSQFPPAKDAQGLDVLVTWDKNGFPTQSDDPFVDWAKSNVIFVKAPDSGTSGIANAVNQINRGNGSIFLIGHSAGGTAIIRYLTELKEGGTPNPGIAGAVAVQAPLNTITPLDIIQPHYRGYFPSLVAEWPLGFNRYDVLGSRDRLAGLGAWARQNGIALDTINYAGDYVNPTRQIADIPQVVEPDRGYAPFGDLIKNHGYFLLGPGTGPMFTRLFGTGTLR